MEILSALVPMNSRRRVPLKISTGAVIISRPDSFRAVKQSLLIRIRLPRMYHIRSMMIMESQGILLKV